MNKLNWNKELVSRNGVYKYKKLGDLSDGMVAIEVIAPWAMQGTIWKVTTSGSLSGLPDFDVVNPGPKKIDWDTLRELSRPASLESLNCVQPGPLGPTS